MAMSEQPHHCVFCGRSVNGESYEIADSGNRVYVCADPSCRKMHYAHLEQAREHREFYNQQERDHPDGGF